MLSTRHAVTSHTTCLSVVDVADKKIILFSIKAKLSLKHVRLMEVKLDSILTSALDGG